MSNISASGNTIVDARGSGPKECTADLAQVVVVASSPINRIVLSRIAERACLKARPLEPREAARALDAAPPGGTPGMVIVDIDAATGHDDVLFGWLSDRRRSSPRRLPLVVAIVGTRDADGPHAALFDATVLRPVTPESLQPVIERLIAGARG